MENAAYRIRDQNFQDALRSCGGPFEKVYIFAEDEKSIAALEEVMRADKQILLAAQKNAGDDDPATDAIFEVGTLASVLQLLTGIYGGYFGAGMGIMMMATLSLLGFANIHQMNGLKNLLGMAINLIAALYFIFVGLVHWPEALVMAVGAIAGGYGGAGLARKLGAKFVRVSVIVIGVGMAISLLLK